MELLVGQPSSIALTVEHDGDVQAIAFSPDSTRFASGGGDSLLRVRAVGVGPPLDVPAPGFTSGIAFSLDGAHFAVADFEQVFLRSASTGAVLWQRSVEPGSSNRGNSRRCLWGFRLAGYLSPGPAHH
jgi:WD40 repeat protein